MEILSNTPPASEMKDTRKALLMLHEPSQNESVRVRVLVIEQRGRERKREVKEGRKEGRKEGTYLTSVLTLLVSSQSNKRHTRVLSIFFFFISVTLTYFYLLSHDGYAIY